MQAEDRTEQENLLSSGKPAKQGTYYDEEANQDNNYNITDGMNAVQSLLTEVSSIDGIKIVVVIFFIMFECIPIIMGGYILNNHYLLYFVGVFMISLFAVMFIAKEKFHYVLILLFTYSSYIFMLFAVAFDAFKMSNAEKYHIEKLKTIAVLWIILQFAMFYGLYRKCCQPNIDTSEVIDDED